MEMSGGYPLRKRAARHIISTREEKLADDKHGDASMS